jgi:hypothetical protein
MLVPAARTEPRLIGFFAARYLRFTLDNRAAWNAGSAVFQEQSTAGRVYVEQRAYFLPPSPSALSAPPPSPARAGLFSQWWRHAQRMTTMERAFHLARSGRFTTLTEVATTLDREGHSANQIQGPVL